MSGSNTWMTRMQLYDTCLTVLTVSGHLQFWLCPCKIDITILIHACVLVTVSSFCQAPLTSTDTAILSGNLSTQNGNGGGSINLAFRRVTSAKGWGEVRMLDVVFIPNLFQAAWISCLDIFSWTSAFFHLCVSISEDRDSSADKLSWMPYEESSWGSRW